MNKKLLALACLFGFVPFVNVSAADMSVDSSAVYAAEGQYAAPVISLESGTYRPNTIVEITAPEDGIVAYRFVSDKSTPSPFAAPDWIDTGVSTFNYTLFESGTLEAKTIGDNGTESEVVSAIYTVEDNSKWAAPTYSVENYGSYPEGTEITITAPEGAYVAYIMDVSTGGDGGFLPADNAAYAGFDFIKTDENSFTFKLEGTSYLTVYSYGEGKSDCDRVFATFYMSVPKKTLDVPTFSPESGNKFTGTDGEVTITAPEGSVVQYMVINNDNLDAYSPSVTAKTNVATITLSSEEGKSYEVRAWSINSTDSEYESVSEMATALYTFETVSVEEISAEFGGNAEFFTMDGVRVNEKTLVPGIYVVVKDGKSSKILVK